MVDGNDQHRRLYRNHVPVLPFVENLMETILSCLSQIFKSAHRSRLYLLINLYIRNSPRSNDQVLIVLVYNRPHLHVNIILNAILQQLLITLLNLHRELRSIALKTLLLVLLNS